MHRFQEDHRPGRVRKDYGIRTFLLSVKRHEDAGNPLTTGDVFVPPDPVKARSSFDLSLVTDVKGKIRLTEEGRKYLESPYDGSWEEGLATPEDVSYVDEWLRNG